MEKDLEEAKAFLDKAEHHGFTVNGRFYDTDLILTMRASPPEEIPGFSDNKSSSATGTFTLNTTGW